MTARIPDLQVEAALVTELGPSFLESNPEVAFHLQRCQFAQLVQVGHTEQALRLLRHSMAPIALKLQHLQPCLKVVIPTQDHFVRISGLILKAFRKHCNFRPSFGRALVIFPGSSEQDGAYGVGWSRSGKSVTGASG